MNIVKPYARIINIDRYGNEAPFLTTDGIALLRKIEWCGRISHRTEEAQTEHSWERFIQTVVMGHGDWSIVEHASVTVDAVVDRGITHEWVRHRLFSFTQESTRFVNYEKKMPTSFIEPDFGYAPEDDERRPYRRHKAWSAAISQAEESYKALIAEGVAPQIARSVFPNALASRIVTTGNLRNWRHFLIMRTTKESHPQMREVTIPLLDQFKFTIPLLFNDIEPMQRQAEAMKKVR